MTTFNLDNVDLTEFDSILASDTDASVDITPKIVVSEAFKVNPESHARKKQMSNQTQIPTDVISDNSVSEFEQSMKLDKLQLDTLPQRSPKIANWLTEFDNAAIAQNDIPVLEKLESWFDKTFDNFGESLSLNFEKQGQGLRIMMDDSAPQTIPDFYDSVSSALPLGMEFAAYQISNDILNDLDIQTDDQMRESINQSINDSIKKIKNIELRQKKATPSDLTILQEGVRSAGISLISQLPGTVLSMVSGNPAPMLVSAGGQTYADSYGTARSKGKTESEAAFFASVDAGIEVLTEVIPAKVLTEMFKGTGITKKLGKFVITDFAGEQIATLGQSLNSYLNDLDDQLNNAKTLEEKLQIQSRRQAVTAVSSIVSSSTQGTVIAGLNKTISAFDKVEKEVIQQSNQDQAKIDNLESIVTQLTMNKNSPELLKQLVEKIEAGQNTHVFLDGAQTRLYLNERQGVVDPAIELIRNSIADNGDIAIPIADFATYMIGTEHFTELRDFMTMREDTIAPFRREDHDREIKQYMTEIIKESQVNTSMYVESQEIANSVRDQLVDTGTMDVKQASQASQIAAQWAIQHAKNNNITVEEAWKLNGIVGPHTGKLNQNSDILNQSVYDQSQNFDNITISEKVKIADTGGSATITESAQKIFDRTFKNRSNMIRLKECVGR